MTQLNLFDLALPEIWKVGNTPNDDGIYKCRLKRDNGKIEFMELESVNHTFQMKDAEVLAYR